MIFTRAERERLMDIFLNHPQDLRKRKGQQRQARKAEREKAEEALQEALNKPEEVKPGGSGRGVLSAGRERQNPEEIVIGERRTDYRPIR